VNTILGVSLAVVSAVIVVIWLVFERD